MNSTELNISGVRVIEQSCKEDFTGWIYDGYSAHSYEQIGIFDRFIQENHGSAFSDGCFRGIHCQEAPFTQAYLIQCINGAMLDFAIDLRKNSPTYRQWTSVILSAENRKLLYIPKGCAHACLSLSAGCEFTMKVSSYYEPSAFKCISYLSPELGIEMPINNPLISLQDKAAKSLEDYCLNVEDVHNKQHSPARFKNDLRVSDLELPGLKLIQPKYYEDFRGSFAEAFSMRKLRNFGLDAIFVQEKFRFNHSKWTFCGIYFQNTPHAQGRLLRCIRGTLLAFAIDFRHDSATFKHWTSVILSAENHKQLWIPHGFGYAYMTLSDHCEVQCRCDNYDVPESQRIIRYDDPEISLKLINPNIIISEAEKRAPLLKDSGVYFSVKDEN